MAIKAFYDEQAWLHRPPSVGRPGKDLPAPPAEGYIDVFADAANKDTGATAAALSSGKTSPASSPANLSHAFEKIAPAKANPAPLPKSGVAAVNVSPAKGLRVVAAENALDKPRRFSAQPLPANRINALYPKYAKAGILPMGGFDLNCGMTADERFAAPVTVEFDLADLGVDPTLWEQSHLAYLDGNGRLRLLQSQREGSKLRCEIRHNGAFLNVLLLATIALGQYYGVFDSEIADYPQSPGKDGYASQWWKPGAPRYVLFYPADWKPADPKAIEDCRKRLDVLVQKYAIAKSPNAYAAAEVAKAMFNDPQYKAIKAEMDSEEFILNKFLPVRAANVVRALDLAVDYCKERNFRAPGMAGVEWTPEVFVQAQSLGPNLYGEARNAWTTRAFLVIDGTKVPDALPAAMNAEQKRAMDSLKTTALHEYFHLVQSAYTFVETPGQLWFAEATALLLEAEGGRDYLARGWAESWDYTARGLHGFFDPLDFSDSDRKRTQQHGYDVSHFVEYLRQKYYSQNPASFLPKLLEDFAAFRGGTIASLYRVTSNDPNVFCEDFRRFAHIIAPQVVFLGANYRLTPGKPYCSWRFDKAAPLSAPGVRISAGGEDFKDVLTPESVAVLRDSSGFTEATDITWSINLKEWRAIKAGLPVAFRIPPIGPKQTLSIVLQRTEVYISPSPTPAAGKGPMATDVYFMLPPKAPQATLTEENLQIDFPKTPLQTAPEPPGMGPYVQGLQLLMEAKDGGEPIQTNLSCVPRVEYPLEQITTKLKPNDNGIIFATLRFREVAHAGQKIYGPWSEPFEIQIPVSAIGQIVWNKPPMPKAFIEEQLKKYKAVNSFALRIEVTYTNPKAKPTIYQCDYDMMRGVKMIIEGVDIPNIKRITEFTIYKPTGAKDELILLESSVPEWKRILAGERIKAKWFTFYYTPRPVGAILRIDEQYDPPPTPTPKSTISGPPHGYNPFANTYRAPTATKNK
ncbi:MAG: hypothetical protein N3D11_05195 [Candidatus Sumerlaeia bacterium]|nr:hypothetical protein [Candidatus Sumerlaeia bacterium]